jgi:cyclomaltodextrinase / maltogenic alpha-amylase / neopullulanase
MSSNRSLSGAPEWVKGSIFYQIFPDRFSKRNQTFDQSSFQPWGSPPTNTGFQGGNFMGIQDKLDYLQDLGVNALYLNPIFLSPSNHRYNTTDYYRTDPKLGNLADFQSLLAEVHRRSMRLILDGVLNHCGRGFFAFTDILENQGQSPYLPWFHVHNLPIDAYSPGPAVDFDGWWQLKSLPKFNTESKAARRYLLDVVKYWTEMGIDGWRLDVPNEIDDDLFWAEFHQVVRDTNPEAYLVGEIWKADLRWVDRYHFDGVMNYPLREAIISWLNNGWTAADFSARLEELMKFYPEEFRFAAFNLLGSHDTERIMTLMGGSVSLTRLAFQILFALPGAPVIYYGDEIGLEGEKDPDCRRAFIWNKETWKKGLREALRQLIDLRKQIPALTGGNFSRITDYEAQGVVAFSRNYEDKCLAVLINGQRSPVKIKIVPTKLNWQPGTTVRDLLSDRSWLVIHEGFELTLPAISACYLL